MTAARLLSVLLLCASACGPGSATADTGLDGLAISAIDPGVVVRGSVIVVTGKSFVDTPWGTSELRLHGGLVVGGGSHEIDVRVPARFVDYDHLAVDVDQGFITALGLDGTDGGGFNGEVTVEVDSSVDHGLHVTDPLVASLDIHDQLTPVLDSAQTGGVIFVNDPIVVSGSGLLLGGGEGTTYAVVQGCFTPDGETGCDDVGPVEIPVVPESEYDRSRGSFAFAPKIAGILPGSFTGTVNLRNQHSEGGSTTSGGKDVDYDLIEPAVFSASPTSASLGQYVTITGGGFVDQDLSQGSSTEVALVGSYTPAGGGSGAVDLLLVPEFVSGRTVRYVLNENDSLGGMIDLRTDTGTFQGTVSPVVAYGDDAVTGTGAGMTLSIAPVRQVVYLNFLPSYVESLRHFGLRAVDARIRERVETVMERDYRTINLEVRTEVPTDFAYYASVDIAGPDPNGQGLFGYDNTPGKDTGNMRLYDRIGGVNATTQEDGYAGYGGVFIESLFGFSEHPGDHAVQLSGADPAFDEVFDPFRPDRGGEDVTAADLSQEIPVLTNGDICPSSERSEQIACAVFVLGSLIGTTVSHEVGHSLGLANPYGDGFHNVGDAVNRLMDGGADRPFLERAELFGEGPALFCSEEYEYLRQILPTDDAPDPTPRPSCW